MKEIVTNLWFIFLAFMLILFIIATIEVIIEKMVRTYKLEKFRQECKKHEEKIEKMLKNRKKH